MSNRQALLFLAAVVAGIFGVMTSNFIVIGLGVIAMAVAFHSLRDTSTMPSIAGHYVLIIFAVLVSGLTILFVVQDVNNPAIPSLWVASMLLFLSAAIRFDGVSLKEERPVAATAGFLRKHGLAIPVLLVAFALRIYNLEQLPPLHGDEGEMGLVALKILQNDGPPIIGTGWSDHPALFHYLQAIFIANLGQTGFALRILSVIAGVVSVALVYQLGRRGWGFTTGLIAAWLMAVSVLQINYSRIGLNNIESTLAILLFLVLLARFKREKVVIFVIAGLVVGLSQYMYFGSRLIPIVAVVLLLFMWKKKMTDLRQIAALALAALISFAPLGAFYITHPAPFYYRSQAVLVLSEANVKHTLQAEDAVLPDDLLPLLGKQLERNLNFFIQAGDLSAFYSSAVPGFDILTSIMFWLGLGVVLARAGRYHEFSLLIWLGLGIFIGGVLTNDAPNSPRLLIVTPAVFLLGGVLIQRVGGLLSSYPKALRYLLLVSILALTGYLNFKIYFIDFAQNFPPSNLVADSIARDFGKVGDDYLVYLAGQPHLYAKYGTIHFLAGDDVEDLDNVAAIPPLNGKGLLVIALPNQTETLEDIKNHIPGGTSVDRVNGDNFPIYTIYEIPAQ